MANNKFTATQMVKCFSKDLRDESVIISGKDGEGEEIHVRGVIRVVRGAEIDVTSFERNRSRDYTFHMYQFDHGVSVECAEDNCVDILYMQILEPGPVVDFTEGG